MKKIDPPVWMTQPATRAVMAALRDDAAEGKPAALFVGGCVRNTLLGQAVDDIDIATLFTPDVVMARLTDAGLKAIPTGVEYGTVTAVAAGQAFEITTLRKDVETFGRRAVVAYTDDWREDAQRRDFTMNTLLADEKGHIYDPTGLGLADLKARRVIFVGDPATRIAEDYLRILRFFRFQARYGAGEPDAVALAACRAAACYIGDLSRERITQEMLKILSVDNPEDILRIMFENKVLSQISNAQNKLPILAALASTQNKYDAFHISTRLFIFQSVDKAGLVGVSPLLLLSNDQKKELKILLEVFVLFQNRHSGQEKGFDKNAFSRSGIYREGGIDPMDPGFRRDDEKYFLKRVLYHYGREMSAQGLLLHMAYAGDEEGLDEAVAFLKIWALPVFPLRGADLLALGVPHGPQIGEILSAVEQWWIEKDFMPDQAACRAHAQTLMG